MCAKQRKKYNKPKLLTSVTEISNYTGVSKNTLYRYIHRKKNINKLTSYDIATFLNKHGVTIKDIRVFVVAFTAQRKKIMDDLQRLSTGLQYD